MSAESAVVTMRSRSRPDDETESQDRTKWDPTLNQFDAYLAREVEMAKVNITKGGPQGTLHSTITVARAQEELAKEIP